MLFSNNRNYWTVCCEAVRSAILATAWPHVYFVNVFIIKTLKKSMVADAHVIGRKTPLLLRDINYVEALR